MQHAIGLAPDPAFGYCTDDVARALHVDLLHHRRPRLGGGRATARGDPSRFLTAAFDTSTGTFRNFRGADGAWLDGGGSEDCQGRAMLALGIAIGDAPEIGLAQRDARALFDAALPAADG